MATRKRNWNAGTPIRYRGKIKRIMRGVYIDPEDASEVAEAQTSSWLAGAEVYRKVRQIAKTVMDSEDFAVSPGARAQYYAYMQKFYKEVVERGLPEDRVRGYLDVLFPDVRPEVIDEIISRVSCLLYTSPSPRDS